MAHDVFISYSAKDKSIADAVCAKLEHNKIRCWIAPRDVLAGQAYAEAIVRAIDECKLLVLILSADADASPHVMRELDQAVNKRKSIISFRIDDVPLSGAMEYYIQSQHWLDAITPPYENHMMRLLEVVMAHLNMINPAQTHDLEKNPVCTKCGATNTIKASNLVGLLRCKNCNHILLFPNRLIRFVAIFIIFFVSISLIKIGYDKKISQDIERFDRYVQLKEETHIHITDIALRINMLIDKDAEKRLNSPQLEEECNKLLTATRVLHKEVSNVSYWGNLEVYRRSLLELLDLEIVRLEALDNGLIAGGKPEDYMPCFGRGSTASYDFDSLNGVFKHDYQKYRHSVGSIF